MESDSDPLAPSRDKGEELDEERWRSEVIVSICKDVTAGGCDYSEHSQSILLASQ